MAIETLDAAKRLGVHPTTITNLCLRGLIRAEKRLNAQYRYAWFIDWDDLCNFEATRWQRRLTTCKPLLETDKAYIAGLLDGEGCFTAFIRPGALDYSRPWNKTIYYIQILVVEEPPIRWLKEVTGLGYVFQRRRQEQGWQDLWGWRVGSGMACEVIKQIIPYLKIKHQHAEIFLELAERIAAMKNYRRGKPNDAPMPEEEYIARQKLIDEIHRLNKRTGKVLRTEYCTPV